MRHMLCRSQFCALSALIVIVILVAVASADAAQLFPPANIGADPNVPCPNGGVLSWSGDGVICVDPTAGVNVSCPAGQMLTGISNGQAVCAGTSTSLSCSGPGCEVPGNGSCLGANCVVDGNGTCAGAGCRVMGSGTCTGLNCSVGGN